MRASRLLVACAAFALFATLGPSALAQTLELPRPRQGYYASVGPQLVTTQIWDHDESLGAWSGPAFSVRIGELLTTRLGLGLEFHYGQTKKGPWSAQFGGLALEGQWEVYENLSLRGSAGLEAIGTEDERDPDNNPGAYGGGYALSVAYDAFVKKAEQSGGLAITPVAGVRFLSGDNLRLVTTFIGVEATYWTGLPSNQLNLTAGEGYRDKEVEATRDAAERHHHDGFYLRMSLGAAALSHRVKDDSDLPGQRVEGVGSSFELLMGATPVDGLAVGGGLWSDGLVGAKLVEGGTDSGREVDVSFGMLGVFADWFFDPRGGFHAGVALGAATPTIVDESDIQTSGPAAALFGGYDAWVSKNWSLGGAVRVMGALTQGDRDGAKLDATTGSVSIVGTALYH
jgi:hypothetical protein